MKRRAAFFVLILTALSAFGVFAQAETAVELRLTRDWGFAMGSNVEGRFSYRVTAPDNVVRVEYLMDDAVIAESTATPYRYQFNTEDFPDGSHTMQAIGYTADGQTLVSNSITRNFLPPTIARQATIWLIGGIFAVIAAGWLIVYIIGTRGKSEQQKAVSGAHGTAVCPKCSKPFARHLFAPNFGTTKYDRCPHCHKWSMVGRASQTEIDAALETLHGTEDDTAVAATSPEDDLRKQLDDSRFED